MTRIAVEKLTELVAVEAKIKKAIVLARGSHLMDLHGVGPVVAARILTQLRLNTEGRFTTGASEPRARNP